MSEELKPCPFCGGEGVAYLVPDYPKKIGPRYSVICNGCGASVTTIFQYKRDAIDAWNRRAERTCRNLNPPSCRDFECSECGESSEFTPGFMPSYCPSCGARVIEEES